MPWRYTSFILQLRVLLGLLMLLGCVVSSAVRAQSIESILAPGKLIQGHAKYEEECTQCHVKFDRKAQDGLCMGCHRDVGADVRARTGYHGHLKPQACNSCHTDHKGRNARIVELDKKSFDHAQTDFRLLGKHEKLACEKCHSAGKKYREALHECNACHKKDDVHKGGLGARCADCHTESSWKETRFDHAKTRFSLTGKHNDIKCVDCHKTNRYKETPRACIGCHRKDDDSSKGHKGLYGEKCDSCHGTKTWKPAHFNHDTDTQYVLRGKHRTARCTDCHTGNLYRVKLSRDCHACHQKDDKHKTSLGKDCGSCHSERSWKEPPRFDHGQSSFPLLGKHAKVECKDCHKSAMFRDAPTDCHACHKKDDRHESTLGQQCADCHTERDWKTTTGRFNHDKTRFLLRNAHADGLLKCNACHKDLKSFRKTPLDCYSCHKKDDKHEGTQGKECGQCHGDRSWKTTRFDHGLTRFPLTGRHITTTCKSCHETQRYKDAPRDCHACHQKEDRHKLKFGVECQDCHNTRGWAIWDFDHGKRTEFKLDGTHRKVACESCHTREAPKGKKAAAVGATCISCHRKDDRHDGQFGPRCEQCHVSENWRKVTNRIGWVDDRLRQTINVRMLLLGLAMYPLTRDDAILRAGKPV